MKNVKYTSEGTITNDVWDFWSKQIDRRKKCKKLTEVLDEHEDDLVEEVNRLKYAFEIRKIVEDKKRQSKLEEDRKRIEEEKTRREQEELERKQKEEEKFREIVGTLPSFPWIRRLK